MFIIFYFWGILGVYLLRVVNPRIDKFIDWLIKKINNTVLKIITTLLIIFLFVDCLISAYAINVFLIRACVEKDLPVSYSDEVENMYHEIYDNKEKSDFINKYFNNEKMILTYPNLTITLEDGSLKRVAEYYPDVRNYYYKFDTTPSV